MKICVLLLLISSPASAQVGVFHTFTGGVDGARPNAGVTEANGTILGTTWSSPEAGTFFALTATGVYTSAHIPGSSNNPQGLTVAVDGTIYGVTQGLGGEYGYGQIYRNDNGAMTVVHTFTGPDGAFPVAMVNGPNGYLFGMTANGGPSNAGTLFKLALDGTLTTVHVFTGLNGATPNAIVAAPDGIYGTTQRGGSANRGVIFHTTDADTRIVYTFTDMTPLSLTSAPDGLFGTTGASSTQGGCIFKLSGSALAVLHCLSRAEGETAGTLLEAEGILYGTSQSGGKFGGGTLFKMSLDGQTTVLVAFHPIGALSANGWSPRSPLVRRPDGSLIGTTRYGGIACIDDSGCGVIFQYQIPHLLEGWLLH